MSGDVGTPGTRGGPGPEDWTGLRRFGRDFQLQAVHVRLPVQCRSSGNAAASAGRGDPSGSAQSEHGYQALVDTSHRVDLHSPDLLAEPADVDGADLLDEHASRRAEDRDLRPDGCRTGTRRGRSQEDDRTREQRVRLHDHPEATPSPFVPDTLRHTKLVDVTPLHGVTP